MRVCANDLCFNALDDQRRDARYCSSTCRAEASRRRSHDAAPPSFPWAALRNKAARRRSSTLSHGF